MTMVDSFVGGDPFNVSANTGGGVTLETSDLYLYDSFILNNIAVNEGGGVYASDRSIIELHGTSAIGFVPTLSNRANDGAGLYLSQTSLDLYDESFIGHNGATEFGGGLYATLETEVTLHDPDTGILSNTARFGGGAYVTGTNSGLFLQDGSIAGNQALAPTGSRVASGGGVYLTGRARIYAGEAEFARNYADLYGGGIYMAQDGATGPTDLLFANGTRVESNYAGYGGGLYLAEDGSRATLDAAELEANVAFTTGGAIRVFGDSELTIENGSMISGNVATYGGGLAIDDGYVDLPFSTLFANEAIENGGGIYQTGGRLSGFETLILGNQAAEGGGLHLFGATTVLTSVEVNGNSANRIGGGIAAVGGTDLHMTADFACLTLPHLFLLRHRYCSEVLYNEAQTQGAGLYVEGSNAYITTTAFFGNEGKTNAGASGAALYAGPFADVSVVSTLFTKNSANDNVAVYVEQDGNLQSDNSTYAGNQDMPLFVHSGGSASLNRNIIWDNGVPADIRGSFDSYCNNTQASLPTRAGHAANISQDPKFVTTQRGPYRLGTGSPAIDACAPGIAERGLDGWRRGIIILPGHTLENYDMGAFEKPTSLFVPLVLRNY